MNRYMAWPEEDMTPADFERLPYSGTCPGCGGVMHFDLAGLVVHEHGGYVRCYGCYEPTPEEIEIGKEVYRDWLADRFWRGDE